MPEAPVIDAELGEMLQKNEEGIAHEIAQALAGGVRRRHQAGATCDA